MRDEVKKVQEELKHCIHEREYYKHYYQKCCGLRHGANLPLNLEMINNNHDQDFKRSEHDIKLHHPLAVRTCQPVNNLHKSRKIFAAIF